MEITKKLIFGRTEFEKKTILIFNLILVVPNATYIPKDLQQINGAVSKNIGVFFKSGIVSVKVLLFYFFFKTCFPPLDIYYILNY